MKRNLKTFVWFFLGSLATLVAFLCAGLTSSLLRSGSYWPALLTMLLALVCVMGIEFSLFQVRKASGPTLKPKPFDFSTAALVAGVDHSSIAEDCFDNAMGMVNRFGQRLGWDRFFTTYYCVDGQVFAVSRDRKSMARFGPASDFLRAARARPKFFELENSRALECSA